VKAKIIGIGAALRKDDGIGIKVANELDLEGVECMECSCDVGLLHAIEGCDLVIIVDAVDFGGRPGEIKVMGAKELPKIHSSTHTMDLGLILSLTELGEQTPRIFIFGIQPADVGFGDSLSVELSRAMPEIKRDLESFVRSLMR